MGKRGFLGEFEQVVLLSLWRLGEGAAGADIHAEIESRGGHEVAITAVYVTLSRLEDKGMTSSCSAAVGEGRGARKVFSIERPGIAALRRARRHLDRFWQGLEVDPAGGGRR